MADTKVSNLTLIPDVSPNDLLYIIDVDSGTSNKVTFNQLTQTTTSAVSALSTNVVNFQNSVLALSGDFKNVNIDLGPLTVDFEELSGKFEALSAEQGGGEDVLSAAENAFSGDITINTTTLTFLSGLLIKQITT